MAACCCGHENTRQWMHWMGTGSCKPSPDGRPLNPRRYRQLPEFSAADVTGVAHLHPFAPAAHRVAEHEEEDERHGGGNGQRDQEVPEVIPGLQGLRRGVVFSELGQDACAWFRAGDVHWHHLVDVHLKIERIH